MRPERRFFKIARQRVPSWLRDHEGVRFGHLHCIGPDSGLAFLGRVGACMKWLWSMQELSEHWALSAVDLVLTIGHTDQSRLELAC